MYEWRLEYETHTCGRKRSSDTCTLFTHYFLFLFLFSHSRSGHICASHQRTWAGLDNHFRCFRSSGIHTSYPSINSMLSLLLSVGGQLQINQDHFLRDFIKLNVSKVLSHMWYYILNILMCKIISFYILRIYNRLRCWFYHIISFRCSLKSHHKNECLSECCVKKYQICVLIPIRTVSKLHLG